MMAIFMIADPAVFTSWTLYSSVLTTLPVAIFLTVPMVFVVTAGEIDLSFPSTMSFAAWAFALVVQAGHDPFLGILAAIATGLLLGLLVGALLVYANLSSLIAAPGMRGIILIVTEGKSIALVTLGQTWAYELFSSVIWGITVQILGAIAFVVFSVFLYRRIASGCRCTPAATIPTAPGRWDKRSAGPGADLRLRRVRRRLRRRLLDDDQLHLVADLGRRSVVSTSPET
jgi:ribose/xylose/arabinose/galactoside ABC-type transport system permease subunit